MSEIASKCVQSLLTQYNAISDLKWHHFVYFFIRTQNNAFSNFETAPLCVLIKKYPFRHKIAPLDLKWRSDVSNETLPTIVFGFSFLIDSYDEFFVPIAKRD